VLTGSKGPLTVTPELIAAHAPAGPPASAPAPASRQPASGSAPLPGIARRGLAAAAAAPGAALRRDRSKDGSRTVCSVCLENYAEGDKVRTPLGLRATLTVPLGTAKGCAAGW